MCGRAISSPQPTSRTRARTPTLPLPPNTPAPAKYRVGSKSCEDKTKHNPAGKRGVEAWPCVVRDGGALRLETQKFGIQRLATHCIWCDGGEWVERKNWREALEAGRLCAVAVTVFAEGITCRMEEDGGLFFLAAIYRGDHFVLLTTDACTTPLLRERALVQREHGAGPPLPAYMDAARRRGGARRRPPSAPRRERRAAEAAIPSPAVPRASSSARRNDAESRRPAERSRRRRGPPPPPRRRASGRASTTSPPARRSSSARRSPPPSPTSAPPAAASSTDDERERAFGSPRASARSPESGLHGYGCGVCACSAT